MPIEKGAADNLIITGFMGTGKSAVGRMVAQRLGRPYIDLDAEIEAQAGKSIQRVFAEEGESHFRALESALLREVLQHGNHVIATGGGTLVDADNRASIPEADVVICLHAEPEAILHRVRGDQSRPLLQVEDPGFEISRLLEMRGEAYASLPWHIDTTELSLDEVVRRVLALARARVLPVCHPGGTYRVRIGRGMRHHVGGALRAAGTPAGTSIALVSNDVVAPLYIAQVQRSLSTAHLRPFSCIIPDGEDHKTLDTVASLYNQFLGGGLDRSGLVLSLGGGVTGDIAGFAASSFMRGVPFAQVPTTLLAMVDAGVGGKTGVDLPQGKNLVGAFKQPVVVAVDPEVLSTLAAQEVRSGMAEVIKHGIIGAPDLFVQLEAAAPEPASEVPLGVPLTSEQLASALRVKIDIVEEDPYERGQRAVLNLGHTVGHALETLSSFQLRHGEAVSIGIVTAARISVALGHADSRMAERIESVLASWGLPVRCVGPQLGPFPADRIWQATAHDKKRRQGAARWVLPRAIGDVTVREDVPQNVVLSVLREQGAL